MCEQNEAGLQVLGRRQYGFDAEWIREKCRLTVLPRNEFVRGQAVIASRDNEQFYSGIFSLILLYIFFFYFY